MKRRLATAAASLVLALACACGGGSNDGEGASRDATRGSGEPDVVTVQHLLVGFDGSVPTRDIERSREEAEALAGRLLARVRDGESFDLLIKQFSDDAYPGIYRIANAGVEPSQSVFRRGEMAPGFADVAFSLEVGGIGLAPWDARRCPYGWHIIRRND